jgi:hypothetical protein
VVAEIIASPDRIWLASTPEREKSVTRQFIVQNLSSRPLKINAVSTKDQRVKATPADKETLPLVVPPQGSAEFIASIDMGGAAGTILRDEIVLSTDNAHAPEVSVPVYVRFGPPPRPASPPGRPVSSTPPAPIPLPSAR